MEARWLPRGFHGVMVSTLDSESSDPSSNLGGTFLPSWKKNTFYSTNRTRLPAPATLSGVVHTDTADRCGTDSGRPRWTRAALPIAGHESPAPPLPSKPRPGALRPSQCRPFVGSPGSLESEAEAEPTESCPARGLRTARLVTARLCL